MEGFDAAVRRCAPWCGRYMDLQDAENVRTYALAAARRKLLEAAHTVSWCRGNRMTCSAGRAADAALKTELAEALRSAEQDGRSAKSLKRPAACVNCTE